MSGASTASDVIDATLHAVYKSTKELTEFLEIPMISREECESVTGKALAEFMKKHSPDNESAHAHYLICAHAADQTTKTYILSKYIKEWKS